MSRMIDLKGSRFGRWRVLSFSHKNGSDQVYWSCVCDCGTKREVKAASLRSGVSMSCGCYHKDRVTTHGMTKTKTFKSWDSMKQRCANPVSPDYYKYGERGITVCDRWIHSFDNFLEDMGERPKGRTLDRIDNDGNYEKSNCRWATTVEQLSNRRNTVRIYYQGSMKTIRELSELSGMKQKIIRDRVYAGWPIEKALFTKNRKAKQEK